MRNSKEELNYPYQRTEKKIIYLKKIQSILLLLYTSWIYNIYIYLSLIFHCFWFEEINCQWKISKIVPFNLRQI